MEKINYLLFLILFLFIPVLILAGSGEPLIFPPNITILFPVNNTIYSITTLDLNWTSNETIINLTYALDSINYSFQINGTCFQETANNANIGEASLCGAKSSGTYNIEVGFADRALLMNYTKPDGAMNNSLWQIKHGPGGSPTLANYTFPKTCWDAYSDKLVLKAIVYKNCGACSNLDMQCWDSSTWVNIVSTSGGEDGTSQGEDTIGIYGYDGNYGTGIRYSTSTHNFINYASTGGTPVWFWEEGIIWNLTISNFTLNVNEGKHNVTIYGKNNNSDIGQSTYVFFTINQTPQSSNNQTNVTSNTTLNDIVQFNLTLTDNFNLSSYIFSWNVSEFWLNFTPVVITGTQITLIENKTINDSRGKFVSWTVYFNDSIGNTNQSEISSFYLMNYIPIVNNVSLTELPLALNTDIKGHGNFTDRNFDLPRDNQTYFYVNKSIVNTANNSFILKGGNVTNNANITFSIRYFDGYNWSDWVNSSTTSASDNTPPTFNTMALVNLSLQLRCSDLASSISKINYTMKNPDGTTITSQIGSFGSTSDVSINLSIDNLNTLTNGTYNITQVSCLDANNNYMDNTTTVDLNFTISNPTLTSFIIPSTSIYTDQTLNFTFGCQSDYNLRTQKINFTLMISDNSFLYRSNPSFFTFDENASVTSSYNIFSSQETANTGNYNISQIGCLDTEGNYFENISTDSLSFSLSVRPVATSSGGGGGSSQTQTVTVNNTLNITITNCNFNGLCEASNGEDFFSCREDCKFPTSGLNTTTDWFFCNDPSKPCINDFAHNLLTGRGIVVDLSILFIIILGIIVASPKGSKINETFKKPLFNKK